MTAVNFPAQAEDWRCGGDTTGGGYIDTIDSCTAGVDVYGYPGQLCPVEESDCNLTQYSCPITDAIYPDPGGESTCNNDCKETAGCSYRTVTLVEEGDYENEGNGSWPDFDPAYTLTVNGTSVSRERIRACLDQYYYFRILEMSATWYSLQYLDTSPGGVPHKNCEDPDGLTDDTTNTGWHTLYDVHLQDQLPPGADMSSIVTRDVEFCLSVIIGEDRLETCTNEVNVSVQHVLVHTNSGTGTFDFSFRYSIEVGVRKFECPLDPGYEARCLEVGEPAAGYCPNSTTLDPSNAACWVEAKCPDGNQYFSPSYDPVDNRCESATYSGSGTPECTRTITFPDVITYSYGTLDEAQNVCYQEASCIFGFSLNGDRDRCERAAEFECPANPATECTGTGLNRTCTNEVLCDWEPVCPDGYDCDFSQPSAPSCPDGGSLNTTNDRCEVDPDDFCEAGYTYSTVNDGCVAAPGCPAGGSYANDTDRCEAVAAYSCDSGYTYNSSTKACEISPACADGSYDTTNNQCQKVAIITCNPGYTFDEAESKCIATPVCPNSGTLDTSLDMCVLSIFCASGYSWNVSTDKCEEDPACPSGGSYNSTSDVCTAGYDTSGCPSGYTWNSSSDHCEKSPACPAGGSYKTSANECRASGSASYTCSYTGSTYSSSSTCTSNCVQSAGCNTGQTYDNRYYFVRYASNAYLAPKPGCDGSSYWSGSYYNNGDVMICHGDDRAQWWNPFAAAYYRSYWKLGSPCYGMFPDGSTCIWDTSVPSGSPTYMGRYAYSSNSTHFDAWDVYYKNYGGNYYWCPISGGSGCSYPSSSTCSKQYSCSTNNNCPSGYSWNGGACSVAASCSNGGSLDTGSDKCYYTLSSSTLCPSGYSYDSVDNRCEVSPTCSSSGSLNASIDKCQLNGSCAGSYTVNVSRDQCELTVPCTETGNYNTTLDKCLHEEYYDCGAGGMVYDPALSVCVMDSTCTAGPSAGVLNPDTDLCEHPRISSCTTDYTYDFAAETCAANAACDPGILSTGLNVCIVSGENLCPGGYGFLASSDVCSKEPVCGNTTYVPDRDACFECASSNACLDTNGDDAYQCSPNSCADLDSSPPVDSDADLSYYQNDGGIDANGCAGQIFIFSGKPNACRLPGKQTQGAANGCCAADASGPLGVDPICSIHEAETVAGNNAERCHLVGEYCKEEWFGIGCVQWSEMYCCFNSKLGRIISEQGRDQLQAFQPDGYWTIDGVKKPNCRGFKPEEFQNIDFSKIDFSEWINDMQAEQTPQLNNEMQNSVNDFYDNMR